MRTLVSATTFDVQNETVHSGHDVKGSTVVHHGSTNAEDNLRLRRGSVTRTAKVNNEGSLHSWLRLRRGSSVSCEEGKLRVRDLTASYLVMFNMINLQVV